MATTVHQPLFVVGCGRSGTTLLYEILCCHPELGWFSRYTNRWPSLVPLAALGRAYPMARRRGLDGRYIPHPSEGHAQWDRIRPPSVRAVSRPLDERDVQPGEAERAAAVIARHLRFHGRPRFVNKNTRNTIRVPYLARMFPDAQFVHVLRDPVPTVASLLKIDWWPDLPVWCFDGTTPTAWEAEGHRPETMAAELWRREVTVARRDCDALGPNRVLEVRYEALVADPRTTVTAVLGHAGLGWTPEFEALFGTFAISDANARGSASLRPEQVDEVHRIAGDLAVQLGYGRQLEG